MDIENEERAPVFGSHGRYSITRDGRLYSEPREVRSGAGRRIVPGRWIKPAWNQWYGQCAFVYRVRLREGGRLHVLRQSFLTTQAWNCGQFPVPPEHCYCQIHKLD